MAMPPPNQARRSAQSHRSAQAQSQPRPGWRRQLRYYYWRLLRLQGTPQEMSRGLAAGVFAGCYPLFGLQTIIGIAIATIVRGNKILAAAGTWISNPITDLPIVAFNYQVGHWVLGGGPAQAFTNLDTVEGWMEMGSEVIVRLMLGSTVVGLIASPLSYFLGIWLIRRVRQRQRLRKGRRLQEQRF